MKLIKNLLMIIVLVVVGVVAYRFVMGERTLTERENRGHALYESGDYAGAYAVYDTALQQAEERSGSQGNAGRIARLRRQMAKCLVMQAEDPARPLVESLELYRRADDLDSTVITDPNIRRLLKK